MTLIDLLTTLLTDDGFAIGYIGEALNHATNGVPL